MRSLIFVTQQVDPEHPVLGTAVPKIRALAERLDEVVVLALSAVPGALPANCRVRTFGAPTKALRGLRYGAVLVPELTRRPLGVLAHMSPVYARLAAPLARPYGVRVLLWYAQWRTNSLLEKTVRSVDVVFTVDRRSFPFESPKVRAIGHGIDLARFRCGEPRSDPRLRLLALGRYSEVKDYPTILRALAEVDAELELYGSLETDADRRHRPELERLAAELGLDGRVRFGGPVPPARVPELLVRADALVSATRGGADKVVLEAAASCRPAFAVAEAFAGLLPPELRFGDARSLAEQLRVLARSSGSERGRLGRLLRGRVEAQHSVEHWADAVLAGLA